jgi:hypothetical protein
MESLIDIEPTFQLGLSQENSQEKRTVGSVGLINRQNLSHRQLALPRLGQEMRGDIIVTTREAVPDNDHRERQTRACRRPCRFVKNIVIGSEIVARPGVPNDYQATASLHRGNDSIVPRSPITGAIDDRSGSKNLRRCWQHDAPPQSKFVRRLERQYIRATGRRADQLNRPEPAQHLPDLSPHPLAIFGWEAPRFAIRRIDAPPGQRNHLPLPTR